MAGAGTGGGRAGSAGRWRNGRTAMPRLPPLRPPGLPRCWLRHVRRRCHRSAIDDVYRRAPSTSAQRGARGMPNPTMATMSRWISFGPPPNVKIVWLRAWFSNRPRRTAPGDPSTRYPGLTDDLEQEPIDLERQLGAVHLGGRSISGVRPSARGPCHLPVEQLEHVDFCVRPRQVDLDPFVIDQARPSPSRCPCAHRRTSVRLLRRPDAGQMATRSWFSWFVISFHPWFSSPTRFAAGTRTSS